jgi:hypothetical protein
VNNEALMLVIYLFSVVWTSRKVGYIFLNSPKLHVNVIFVYYKGTTSVVG